MDRKILVFLIACAMGTNTFAADEVSNTTTEGAATVEVTASDSSTTSTDATTTTTDSTVTSTNATTTTTDSNVTSTDATTTTTDSTATSTDATTTTTDSATTSTDATTTTTDSTVTSTDATTTTTDSATTSTDATTTTTDSATTSTDATTTTTDSATTDVITTDVTTTEVGVEVTTAVVSLVKTPRILVAGDNSITIRGSKGELINTVKVSGKVAAADFNGDGEDDIVVNTAGQVSLHKMDGSNLFTFTADQAGIAVGDYDGNGTPEFLTAAAHTVTVYDFEGKLLKTVDIASLGENADISIATADVTGDRIVDIIAGDAKSNQVAVYNIDGTEVSTFNVFQTSTTTKDSTGTDATVTTADSTTTDPATTTADSTTTDPATTTADSTTTDPATTTADSTTTDPATTTADSTTTDPATTTADSTTTDPATTTADSTTTDPATTTTDSTTTDPATTTADLTTTDPATTTTDSTTTDPATTTNSNSKKIVVCHGGKSLSIASSALKAHLAHGDTEGACAAGTSTTDSTTDTTTTTTDTTTTDTTNTATTTTAPETVETVGVNVAAGDVDGDGQVEVIAAMASGGSTVEIYRPDGTLVTSFNAFDSSNGVVVATGDADNNGTVDIIVGQKGSTAVQVFSLNGSTATPFVSFTASEQGNIQSLAVATQLTDGTATAPEGEVVVTATPEAMEDTADTITDPTVIAAPSCQMTSDGLNTSCNGGGLVITEDSTITEDLSVANVSVDSDVVNEGLLSNSTIQEEATVTGGKLSGDILNKGVIVDITFGGRILKGGTLKGKIIVTAPIELRLGIVEDVTLAAGTQLSGGRLQGKITGSAEEPALLENTEVAANTELSNVVLGEGVTLGENVTLNNVTQQ